MTALDDPLLPAKIYELIHRGNAGDLAFYLDACRGAERVLELGCGSGRLARALCAQGSFVLGVDCDGLRIALARQHLLARGCGRSGAGQLALVCADATQLPLASAPSFDRVIIAYNTLCALGSDDAVLAVLTRAAALLRDGGELYLDVYLVDPDPEQQVVAPGEGRVEPLCTVMFDGLRVDVLEQEVGNAAAPRAFELRYRYLVASDDTPAGVVERELRETLRHWALPGPLLEQLLGRAGLSVFARWGDFRGALDAASEQLVLGARPMRGQGASRGRAR
ncbi:MAG: class I SAM-dependent methyltransferase [Myxococcales bacterium]|nr:class I SAM-dependent methyltransferase [Myxococcales bacterium]